MGDRMGRCAGVLLAGALSLFTAQTSFAAPVRITLQFDAALSAEQAPFYLALSKGWFTAAGIEAVLVPGTDPADTAASVAAGKADIGAADVSTVLAFRSQGVPLRIVASLGDLSGLCAYSLSSSRIAKPQELTGKKIAVDPFDAGWTLFPLLAANNGMRTGDVTFLPMPYAERIGALASGSADAVFGSLTENRALAKAVGAGALSRMLWADFSFIPYGRCLFVRESTVGSKPAAVRAFFGAAFKAWELALRDPDQAAAALGKYRIVPGDMAGGLSDDIRVLLPLFKTAVYKAKGIGFLDPARMDATLKAAADLQGIPLRLSAADVMTAALLPSPPVKMP